MISVKAPHGSVTMADIWGVICEFDIFITNVFIMPQAVTFYCSFGSLNHLVSNHGDIFRYEDNNRLSNAETIYISADFANLNRKKVLNSQQREHIHTRNTAKN